MISTKWSPFDNTSMSRPSNFGDKIIKFLHYYRLVWVLLILVFVGLLIMRVYHTHTSDRLNTLSILLTSGSIVLGIFYSILNYEYTHRKSANDDSTSKTLLSFNTANKFSEEDFIKHSKELQEFYENYEDHFASQSFDVIEKLIYEAEKPRIALVCMLNFFENTALAVNEKILNENMIKMFFRSIFIDYLTKWGGYVEYQRIKRGKSLWLNFSEVAQRWSK